MAIRGVYGRLSELKARANSTRTALLDSQLLQYLEDASRRIDDVCQRHFYSLVQTQHIDGHGRVELDLYDDLISVTALRVDDDGDASYGLTLAADTDYWLWPPNRLPNEPAKRIDLNPNGANLFRWPYGRRRVQITGKFGYSDETEVVRTATGEAVLVNGAISDSATSITLDTSHGVDPGETLVIGIEQLYVAAVNDNTLTVERGVNGTTAASALDDAAVLRRVYPRAVTEVCLERALQAQWAAVRGTGVPDDVDASGYVMGEKAIRNRLSAYLNWTGIAV